MIEDRTISSTTQRTLTYLFKGIFVVIMVIFAMLTYVTVSQANELKIIFYGKSLPTGYLTVAFILMLIFLYLGFSILKVVNKKENKNIKFIPFLVFLLLTGTLGYTFIKGLIFIDDGVILDFKGIKIIKLASLDIKLEAYFSNLNSVVAALDDLNFKRFLQTCAIVQKPNYNEILSTKLLDIYSLVSKNISLAKDQYLAILQLNQDVHSSFLTAKNIVLIFGFVCLCVCAGVLIYKVFSPKDLSTDLHSTVSNVETIRQSTLNAVNMSTSVGAEVAQLAANASANLMATTAEINSLKAAVDSLNHALTINQNAIKTIAVCLDSACRKVALPTLHDTVKNVAISNQKMVDVFKYIYSSI